MCKLLSYSALCWSAALKDTLFKEEEERTWFTLIFFLLSGSKKPPTANTSQLTHDTASKQLGNAQLLFEPSPPKLENTAKNRSPSPSIRRRTQSAKTSHKKTSRSLFASPSGSSERRPVSAVVPGEKKYFPTSKQDGHRDANRRPIHVAMPTQFLEFEDSEPACPHHPSLTEPLQRHVPRRYQVELEFKGREPEDVAGRCQSVIGKNLRRSRTFPDDCSASEDSADTLPRGIAALASWLTPGLPTEWWVHFGFHNIYRVTR